MLRVVSFNCDYCHRRIILGIEPSWMRFEPAINAGVAYNIYVGGATGSMGSLQNFSTQHKTRNQEFLGSIRRSLSEFLLPVAACPCLPLSGNRHVKKRSRFITSSELIPAYTHSSYLLLCGNLFPASSNSVQPVCTRVEKGEGILIPLTRDHRGHGCH